MALIFELLAQEKMLSLDANVIVVFLIVWILVFLLSKLFFGRLRRIRDEREKGIAENKRAHEEALRKWEASLREVEASIKQARADAESTRESLAAEALWEKGRLVSEISRECRAQVDKARADLEQVVEELKTKLEGEAADLAERIERKLLS